MPNSVKRSGNIGSGKDHPIAQLGFVTSIQNRPRNKKNLINSKAEHGSDQHVENRKLS